MKKSIMVKSVFGWLVFITMVIFLFSGSLMSLVLKEVKVPEFEYGSIPLLAKFIPLIISTAALLIIITLIMRSKQNKKILDCIEDRGTPDGE